MKVFYVDGGWVLDLKGEGSLIWKASVSKIESSLVFLMS